VNNANRTTKKVLLVAGILIVFFAYTFALRGQKSGSVIGPASSKSGSTTTSSSSTGSSGSSSTTYKDGSYTGSVADAYYGNIQVQVTISGGKITDIQFLQAPNDNPNSQNINQQADPMLKQEAIQSQNANVDTITGATDSSQAFVQSLSAALNQAKA
jgi:uncharacterized protein with FMN-binding domain